MRAVERPATRGDPGGAREPHVLQVGTGRAALDAAEAAQGMTAGLMVLTKGAT
jgi:hypothetical protein